MSNFSAVAARLDALALKSRARQATRRRVGGLQAAVTAARRRMSDAIIDYWRIAADILQRRSEWLAARSVGKVWPKSRMKQLRQP